MNKVTQSMDRYGRIKKISRKVRLMSLYFDKNTNTEHDNFWGMHCMRYVVYSR